MADQQTPRRTISLCKVKGCRLYDRPQVFEGPPPPTDHPDSHYSQEHAKPADIAPRSGRLWT